MSQFWENYYWRLWKSQNNKNFNKDTESWLTMENKVAN